LNAAWTSTVRLLKIYASDPMVGRDVRTRISIDTRNEPLLPGPAGARIVVVDISANGTLIYGLFHGAVTGVNAPDTKRPDPDKHVR
jgi:hypothetical protein